jgi:protoporphyrinogen oxidase
MTQPLVTIIGGGLSGLAAAAQLQELGLPYRLIEVKKRLGGSIVSMRRDRFLLDGGSFAFPRAADWSFLSALGLDDALIPVADGHFDQSVAFKDGTQTLIDALAKGLTGTIIHRMAVSSIGALDGQFTLCLENGLVWDAPAIIVAAPARHAERMFRTLQPEASLRLFDYGYDTIARVSLGFRRDDVELPPAIPWDMAAPFHYWTEHPNRVPAGHVLLHIGVRLPRERAAPDAIMSNVLEHVRHTAPPVMAQVDDWPEADPLPPHTPGFAAHMADLRALLPAGVALCGSDYAGLGLAARIAQGREAAHQIAAWMAKR